MFKIKILLLISILFLSFFYSACQKDDAAPPPILEVEDTDKTINLPAEETSKTISFKTNVVNWTASSDQSWCSVETNNADNAWLGVTVSANTTFDVRTANVKITAAGLTETIKVTQLGTKPVILIDSRDINLNLNSQQLELKIASNTSPLISFSETWIKQVENEGLKGANTDMVDFAFLIEVEQLENDLPQRQAKVYFSDEEAGLRDSVMITQSLTGDIYKPEDATAFEKDLKLNIQSVTLIPADKYQSGEGANHTIDGQTSTIYHSPWGGMTPDTDITMVFNLENVADNIVNYVVLHPRNSGPNGIIKMATIWVNTYDDETFKQMGTIEAPFSNQPVVVRFATPVIRPKDIKLVITDAYSGDEGKYYVSLAEFECYESKAMNSIEQDLQFFTDMTCSELNPGSTINDIASIQNPFLQNIAAYLLAGEYPAEFRVQNYEPVRELADLTAELKTSTYSQFENMTGMYFESGDEVVLFTGSLNGEKVSLRVTDFGQSGDDFSYPLAEGLNVLTMKGKGNGYLSYYTKNYKSASPVKVHIASGKVNGYFDAAKHSEEYGMKLLDNAVSPILDVKGQRVHLAYSVNSLRNQCYGRLAELMVIYDSIVSSQHTIMGLEKYNRLPKNKMFGRVIWDGYMHADGWGAAFHDNTMGDVANPDNLRRTSWGVAHEFGHVNQVRPGMKWVGTTECTNNIYSAWIQYCYTPNSLRLEHENIGGDIGGRFNAFLNNGLVKGQEWGIQAGPDRQYGADENGDWGGDHFVKLVPLWQLQLYFHVAGEGNAWHRPYFWAEIFEKVRQTDEKGLSDGQLQINFMKNACDALQFDLSDFFIKIGMLKVIDKSLNDYGVARKTITQSMVDEVISYASKYPKPETDYIYYISGNCIDAFKNKRQVAGTFNAGVSGSTTKTISHSNWQNVVVFETYAGNELTNITMVGTGSNGNTSSKVPYPSGSTRIEAVGYDGTRVLVFGVR